VGAAGASGWLEGAAPGVAEATGGALFFRTTRRFGLAEAVVGDGDSPAAPVIEGSGSGADASGNGGTGGGGVGASAGFGAGGATCDFASDDGFAADDFFLGVPAGLRRRFAVGTSAGASGAGIALDPPVGEEGRPGGGGRVGWSVGTVLDDGLAAGCGEVRTASAGGAVEPFPGACDVEEVARGLDPVLPDACDEGRGGGSG